MICINASFSFVEKMLIAFYRRDAMLAQSLPSKDVHLSVVYHTPVLRLNS